MQAVRRCRDLHLGPFGAQNLRLFARALIVLCTVLASPSAMISHAYDRELPVVAHYSSEYARVGFILDRSGELSKLKFDGSEEVLVLHWAPAAGGDRLLKRDDDAVILRISGLGGVTLFTSEFQSGTPVGPDRRSVYPIVAVVPPIGAVRDVAGRIMTLVRAETGREVIFEANWDEAARDSAIRGLLFDATRNAGTALINWIRLGPGRRAAGTSLRRVRFMIGGGSGAYRQGEMFVVTINSGQGMAGRPSSYVIFRQLAQFGR